MATDWGLVVHHMLEVQDDLADAMRLVLGDARIVRATNIEEAKRLLEAVGIGSCKLIAAGIRVPLSPRDSLALDGVELTTLELVTWVRTQWGDSKPPVVLFASYADPNRAVEVAAVPNLEIVRMSFNVQKTFQEAAQRLLGKVRRATGPVDIDIELQHDTYRWRAQSTRPPLEAAGALDIRRSDIDDLKTMSSVQDFNIQYLSLLGRKLYEHVMQASADDKCTRLGTLLENYCGDDGLSRARIRFIVDDHTYPILLESVARPPQDGKPASFWMLQAPMFRRYEVPGKNAPLFKDKASRSGKLDCLLIQGDVRQFFASGPLEGRAMPAIEAAREEVRDLADFLRRNRERFRIGEVEVLRHPGGEEATAGFVESVKKALSMRNWGLVHYAGHSNRGKDEHSDKGFMVFGPGSAGVVDATQFAEWVSQSQFLYLSSCQSADAYFVLGLVKRTVPAILGYRWPVKDSHAKFFADNFYANLFERQEKNRHLEYAFLDARKALYGQAQINAPVWAAPMLVMQMSRAESD